MIEGTMRHGTDMEVEGNYVDSHGQSEIGFGGTARKKLARTVTRTGLRRDHRGMKVNDVAELYRKNADGLVRFAASQVGPDHAEDVVSTAVIGVLQSPNLRIEELRPYLFRAVANAAAKHWRTLDRRARREALVTGRRSEVHAPDPRPDLTTALATLSPQQRAVIHLAYWDDLTPSAIAGHLGVSDGTVRRQLARARRRLAAALPDHAKGTAR